MKVETVTLALDGEVSLKLFADEIQHLTSLLEALASEVAAKTKVEWIVDQLEAGSAAATVRGESRDPEGVERIVRAYGAIGRALERNQSIPYSDRVGKHARAIISVLNGKVTAVRFETPEEDATIYSEAVQKAAPAERMSAYGAVEGAIETLTKRHGLRFTLYDVHNDRAVSCYLAEGQEELMRGAWGRRAIVEGWVSRDRLTGRPIAVRQVQAVEILADLPPGNYRQARGAVPIGATDEKPEDVIRRLRDA